MNRKIKLSLKIFVGFLIIITCCGILGGWYLNSNLLSFESRNTNILHKEIEINGYTFLDRNGNGKLDPYEDQRNSIQDRAEDILSKMTLDEKIHLLKGS